MVWGPRQGATTATTGTKCGANARGGKSERGLELRHHLSANKRAWDLAVPLLGDRSLEPKGRG